MSTVVTEGFTGGIPSVQYSRAGPTAYRIATGPAARARWLLIQEIMDGDQVMEAIVPADDPGLSPGDAR
ncbi:MAG: hypothetical protein AB7U83_24970 [Vicinamibacterales bacterium]